MTYRKLTDAEFVYQAMNIRDELGPDAFNRKYGRGPAKWWMAISREGKLYDSKAIYAAAHDLEFGFPPDANGNIFSGGLKQVVQPLRDIGIVVVDLRSEEIPNTSEMDMIASMPEGRQVTIMHFRRERQPKLVRAKKNAVLADGGRLACEGCGFVYADHYGSRGSDYIECHHTRFVSTLSSAGEQIGLDDLALVCANCHRMIHTKWPWLTMPELVSLLTKTAGKAL